MARGVAGEGRSRRTRGWKWHANFLHFFLSTSPSTSSTLPSTLNSQQNKQGRVRVALNDANRARKAWEAATSEGAAAATEWANAVLQEA